MFPTVSVIVPTYNRARWLPETVDCLIRQTCPPLEILIVDDGSSDDTAAVCATLPAPVRYIRQGNAGVSAARNRGIRESKGAWLAFDDSDDPWEPTKLEVQLTALALCPRAQWSITGCAVIDLEGRSVPGDQGWVRVFGAFLEGKVDPDRHFADWLEKASVTVAGVEHRVYSGDAFGLLFLGNIALPSSAVIRRDLAARLGGFDEAFRLAEETEFFHRVAAAAPVAVVMSPLVRYRTGQANSLVSPGNIVRLHENALASLERAVTIGRTLSEKERNAFTAGKLRLSTHLAYSRLATYDRYGARTALRQAWKQGVARDLRTCGIFAATFFPNVLLRALRKLKKLAHSAQRLLRGR